MKNKHLSRTLWILVCAMSMVLYSCKDDDTISTPTAPAVQDPPVVGSIDSPLFKSPTSSSCQAFATLMLGDFLIENNTWNTGSLGANSFSQCIYVFEDSNSQLFGWDWRFPESARGVIAYPQLIYGWKPWQPASTTRLLPREIVSIERLKVTYEVQVNKTDGPYNLAFDNWINASASVNPGNIQFEFMIWEDASELVPFGAFQGEVTTTHGTYQFFRGEPDWEPPGSNWTYLAFRRTEPRNKGIVDVDELLTYLVESGVVPAESYLAAVEFGNEVGGSSGQTVVKTFDVDLE